MDSERIYCRKRSSYFLDNYGENEINKRGKLLDPTTEHTTYRYLCPKRKAGRLIGRGGEVVKHIRADTGARVLIEDAVQGCDDHIITISSSSKETNLIRYKKDYACPAQDALFMVHERLVIDEPWIYNEDDDFNAVPVTARLLIPSDQARCVIGRRGHTIQNMRKDTGAHICIWNDKLIPVCADSNEELLEISGDALVVREALFQVSCLLQEYPSRYHNQISSKVFFNPLGCHLALDPAAKPYSPVEDGYEFILRLVCPKVNIRDVIGKGRSNINQIRQESGATINLQCYFDDEDFMIFISSKEFLGILNSPTINAAIQLQPDCSSKEENECDGISYVTRLLVLRSEVGGLIGKMGLIIKEMRRTTKAIISVIEDSLPSVASVDDALVQICGDLPKVRAGLVQVIDRLKIIHFARAGLVSKYHSASSRFLSRAGSTHESVCPSGNFEPSCRGHSHPNEYEASVGCSAPPEIHADPGSPQVDGDN